MLELNLFIVNYLTLWQHSWLECPIKNVNIFEMDIDRTKICKEGYSVRSKIFIFFLGLLFHLYIELTKNNLTDDYCSVLMPIISSLFWYFEELDLICGQAGYPPFYISSIRPDIEFCSWSCWISVFAQYRISGQINIMLFFRLFRSSIRRDIEFCSWSCRISGFAPIQNIRPNLYPVFGRILNSIYGIIYLFIIFRCSDTFSTPSSL